MLWAWVEVVFYFTHRNQSSCAVFLCHFHLGFMEDKHMNFVMQYRIFSVMYVGLYCMLIDVIFSRNKVRWSLYHYLTYLIWNIVPRITKRNDQTCAQDFRDLFILRAQIKWSLKKKIQRYYFSMFPFLKNESFSYLSKINKPWSKILLYYKYKIISFVKSWELFFPF